jgi:hypothetical protein
LGTQNVPTKKTDTILYRSQLFDLFGATGVIRTPGLDL